jgi:hypothetical protein
MIAALHRIESSCGLRLTRLARINGRSPQSRGLIQWWPLSTSTGNVAPEIVDANHGSTMNLSCQLRELSWRADATFGFAPQFDGSCVIRFLDAGFPGGASPRTISLWVNFTESPPGCIRAAMSCGTTADTHAIVIGAADIPLWQPAGALGMTVWNTHLIAPRAYHDGQWHQAAAVLDDVGWSLYVDGRLENFKTLAEMPTDTWFAGYAFIGGLNYGTYTHLWRGLIRDVRVYRRALSSAEIWSLYDPATRFDLWMPRRSWLVEPPPPPPFLQPQAQIYVTGQENGQCQHPGATAGEVK